MRAADNVAARLKAAERELKKLTAEVARNDAKMHQTQQRELRLLHAEDLETLIRELLSGLRESYGL